jgi:flavin-dependent dehydrogenase
LASGIAGNIRLNSRVVSLHREGNSWIATTADRMRFRSRYIVGADGPTSIVARTVFGYRHACIPAVNYEVNLDAPIAADELQMFFGSQIAPKGYAWIFPISEHTANIGLLMKGGGKVRDYFARFLEKTITPRYGSATLGKQKSGVIPVGGFPRILISQNALLVGDAGAFTDPIFSGGMSLALLSGRLAAQSINRDCPAAYQQSIDALPFSGTTLYQARETFYEFGDIVYNQLGEVLQGKGTDYLASTEGRRQLSESSVIRDCLPHIVSFAETWRAAKKYLW